MISFLLTVFVVLIGLPGLFLSLSYFDTKSKEQENFKECVKTHKISPTDCEILIEKDLYKEFIVKEENK